MSSQIIVTKTVAHIQTFFFFVVFHLQTMAKVITSMLKFPPDQAQKVLENEDAKSIVSISAALCSSCS